MGESILSCLASRSRLAILKVSMNPGNSRYALKLWLGEVDVMVALVLCKSSRWSCWRRGFHFGLIQAVSCVKNWWRVSMLGRFEGSFPRKGWGGWGTSSCASSSEFQGVNGRCGCFLRWWVERPLRVNTWRHLGLGHLANPFGNRNWSLWVLLTCLTASLIVLYVLLQRGWGQRCSSCCTGGVELIFGRRTLFLRNCTSPVDSVSKWSGYVVAESISFETIFYDWNNRLLVYSVYLLYQDMFVL